MLDEQAAIWTGSSTDEQGYDVPRPSNGIPVIERAERWANWVNLHELCRLASVRLSTPAFLAWRMLARASEQDGRVAIGGRPVRMAQRIIQSRDCFYMHAVDARTVLDPFRALVRSLEKKLEKQFGRYDPETHAGWLDFSEASAALGPDFAPELHRNAWLQLSEDLRAGRRTFVAGEHVRACFLARGGSRIRMHIHRDDLHLIDWRQYRDDGRHLTLRQIADHFKGRDVWMGIVAERLMTRAGAAFRATGRYRLRGIDLGQVAVPTPQGLRMRVPAASLIQVERIVTRINDRLIDSDFNYIPPKDEELGSFVDHREFEPAAMTMAPY